MSKTSKPATHAIKPLPPKKTESVKGGEKPGRLAANHNLTIVQIG